MHIKLQENGHVPFTGRHLARHEQLTQKSVRLNMLVVLSNREAGSAERVTIIIFQLAWRIGWGVCPAKNEMSGSDK